MKFLRLPISCKNKGNCFSPVTQICHLSILTHLLCFYTHTHTNFFPCLKLSYRSHDTTPQRTVACYPVDDFNYLTRLLIYVIIYTHTYIFYINLILLLNVYFSLPLYSIWFSVGHMNKYINVHKQFFFKILFVSIERQI